MSTVRLLSPARDLVDEVIALLVRPSSPGPAADGGNNLSGSVVVFPGKRPAHVLRKKLSAHVGSASFPPRIFSIDLFVDFLFASSFGDTTPPVSDYDAVAILFDLHKGMQDEQKIGKEHFGTLETFYPVGMKIFSELEELMIASVSPQQLRESVASVTLASAHALSLLYHPFYEELQKRRLTSRALKYRTVADHIREIDLSTFNAVVFAGFYAFTPTEESIVRHLLSLNNVTFLFQNGVGIHTTLERLKTNPAVEGEETNQEVHFYESPDAHGQLFVLNRVLEQSFPRPIVESHEAVIVLPSAENLFPLYHQTLSAYDQSAYNLALGYPLSRTPVYGFLISLLEVIVTSRNGEVFVPKYIQFLLHPYTKNVTWKTRTDVTRIAVHTIEDFCLAQSARTFVSLDFIEQDPRLHADIMDRLMKEGVDIAPEELRLHIADIHAVTLRSFLQVKTIAEFAEASIMVLQFINEHSTAHRHPYFRPFVETLLEQFVLLGESLLAGHSFTKLEHYLLFLRHCVEGADVPFTGTPLQGLQVLGFLETRGLRFDHLMMIDVNDDVLPGKAQQDVLLPLQIREQLGLSTYREQERIKAYIFDVLRRGARHVHYFSVNNNEKEPSRFIAELQWREQRQRRSMQPCNTAAQEYAIDLGTGGPGIVQKDPTMISLLKEMQYSSTALDSYLTCGLQFYYRFVLRLKEKSEISGDVEQTDVGKMVHAILYEFFSPLQEKTLTAADLDLVRLSKVVREQFRTVYGSTQWGEQFFTRRQVEKHLADYIEKIQTPLVKNAQVVIEALEAKFTVEIENIQYTGNADRIETRDDKTYILDFKTGHHESNYLIRFDDLKQEDRSTWKKAIGSLQLPMYMMLYSVLKKVPAETIVPMFVFLGKKELDDETEIKPFESDDQLKEWYPSLQAIIGALVREIQDEKIPFTPTDDMKNDCPTCPFRFMCGTQWAEKYAF